LSTPEEAEKSLWGLFYADFRAKRKLVIFFETITSNGIADYTCIYVRGYRDAYYILAFPIP
jgi:hypothetical protein